MDFSEFLRALPEGAVGPTLLFHGTESFLARSGVDLLRKRIISEGGEAFDFASFWGKEADAETVAAHASTVPMISEQRLTVVYEVDHMRQAEKNKLLKYVRAPAPGSCLALVSFGRLSRRTSFERELLDICQEIVCDPPSHEQVASIVRKMAEDRGKTIAERALSLLVRWTEWRLGRAANELDKLVCYIGDRGEIASEDIEAVVGTHVSTMDDLSRAVAGRDRRRALELIGELLEGGTDAAQVVSQLFGQWMTLWRMRSEMGGRAASVQGASGPGRRADGTDESARELALRRTSREYADGVRMFYRTDIEIREGRPAGHLVGMLVYELCRPPAGDGPSGA